jgi:hypothetical protein
MRVSKRREGPVCDSSRLTRRVISTANLWILPILVKSGHRVTPQEQNVTFKKSRADWTFLQIVVQSPICEDENQWHQSGFRAVMT